MKKYRSYGLFLLLGLCSYLNAYPQTEELDSVQLYGKTFAFKKYTVGKQVLSLDGPALKKFQGQNLSVALNSLEGVYVEGANSAPGSPQNIRIRGGSNRQVVILLDGVRLSDPSGINTSFDLNLINLDQVERIDLIKGASSSLYGSGAGVAVINIISKSENEAGFNLGFISTVRSYNTAEEALNFNGFLNTLNLNYQSKGTRIGLNAYYDNSSGFSEAEIDSEQAEKDAFSKKGFLFKYLQKLDSKLSISAYYRHDEIDQDFDNGPFQDGLENLTNSTLDKVDINLAYQSEGFGLKWLNSYISTNRLSDQENTFSGGIDQFEYDANNIQSELIAKKIWNQAIRTTTGVYFDYQSTRNYSPYELVQGELYEFNNFDFYQTFVYDRGEGLGLDLGFRINHHNVYGLQWTYDVNPFYHIVQGDSSYKFYASLSSAYITPSLYQMFSFYGNTDLIPEEDLNFEFGWIGNLKNQWAFSALYFSRFEDNPIIFFTDPSTYESFYINDLNQRYAYEGAEFSISKRFKSFKFDLAYTHTWLDEDKNNYVPQDLVKFNAFYDLNRWNFNLNYQYTGERYVQDFSTFPATITTLDAFGLVNAGASFRLNSMFEFNSQVNNVFNVDYQERLGYETLGFNMMFGLNIRL